jgi:hypothetical protein
LQAPSWPRPSRSIKPVYRARLRFQDRHRA